MTTFAEFVESRPAVRKAGDDVITYAENLASHLVLDAPTGYDFIIESGRKYHKMVMVTNSGDRSVHCFIDKKTGDVLKAESWKSPSKGVRYNLLDEYSREKCYDECGWTTHYLYRNV